MKNISKEVQSKYRFQKNTFVHAVKNDKRDRIDVEVGDIKQPDFKPQFKMMRWGNKVNFSVRSEEHPLATVKIEGEKIKYITPDYEVHQYEKPDASENGGFEFEWILSKRPKTNILKATIQSKGLNFYYQEKIDKNSFFTERPDNIIGSYAVYASEKRINYEGGKKYGTGKVAHIYRPKAIDSLNNETWCKLNIENGILTVEVPKEFLKNAKYPVIVDPTIGYNTIGASLGTFSNTTHPFCSLYNPISAVTGDKITQYSLYTANAGSNSSLEIAAYSIISGGASSLLTTAQTLSITSGTPQWWNTGTVSHTLSNGVDYGLAFGNWSTSIIIYGDSSTGNNIDYEDTDAALPATWGHQAYYSDILSIYATYLHAPIDINYSYNIFIDKGKL